MVRVTASLADGDLVPVTYSRSSQPVEISFLQCSGVGSCFLNMLEHIISATSEQQISWFVALSL